MKKLTPANKHVNAELDIFSGESFYDQNIQIQT